MKKSTLANIKTAKLDYWQMDKNRPENNLSMEAW